LPIIDICKRLKMTAKKQGPRKEPFGRPTKYDPSMCETVVRMMSEGCSKAEVCAALDIHFDTLQHYQQLYPDFFEAVKKGLALSQAFYEKEARKSMIDRDTAFPWTGWYMQMKNRFGYSDKQENHNSTAKTHDDWVKEMSQ
jgi:hypothetical protein